MIDQNLIAGVRAVSMVLFCIGMGLNIRAMISGRRGAQPGSKSAPRGHEPFLTSYPVIFTTVTALMFEVFVGSYFVGS